MTENKDQHKIHVDRALMDDIVRPNFDRKVEIKAVRCGPTIEFEDIETLEEDEES